MIGASCIHILDYWVVGTRFFCVFMCPEVSDFLDGVFGCCVLLFNGVVFIL